MKDIIKKNVKSVDTTKDVAVIVYYRSTKVHILLIDNNITLKNKLTRAHAVYKINCLGGD